MRCMWEPGFLVAAMAVVLFVPAIAVPLNSTPSSFMSTSSNKRSSNGNTQKHLPVPRLEPKRPLILDLEPDPRKASHLVLLSSTVPSHTPLETIPEEILWGLNATNRNRVKKEFDFIKRPVCDVISRWNPKTEAIDMAGNVVTVVQKISVGNSVVNQFFYERSCAHEERYCKGIDSKKFESQCETRNMYGYAKVRDRYGTEGWGRIAIPGGCECVFYQKDPFGLIDNN
ncbi:brain-derived neurotrophic factor [Lingula anatina]|uniref:Brain-derived neurotrophic factor n=1 Tax=Lingula anatina TaxID=7574 RepID=A0A1S3HDD4_LINAN|nr:brain-derived neurotrophic factor [Lingula anatina]|eukprot:XP_013383104.1 brain-derived neurotrophic factor [Lingula anatina]